MIQIDRRTIIQIFGSLMCRPSILSDLDKFQLEVEDFHTTLDRYIFSAIYNLYVNGAELLHAVDIENYLSSNEVAKKCLEKENGITFLQNCETYSEVENFSYYYTKLKKINLLRDLQKDGYDISEIYTENTLDNNYAEIMDAFEKLTPNDIINKLKSKVATYENKYTYNNYLEESNAFVGIKQLIVNLKKEPEIGQSLQGDILNTITRGARLGKLYLRSLGSGVGKAIPNCVKIPTPKGWKKVGDIKVGDYLFDKNGQPTQVLQIHPQPEKKKVYIVHFESGLAAQCCIDHLWSCRIKQKDKEKSKGTFSTKQLMKYIKECEIAVPTNKAVEYKEKNFISSPVTMGSKTFLTDEPFPIEYLYGSISQRLELLSGIMKKNFKTVESFNTPRVFITENETLKDRIFELCRSLGLKVNCKKREVGYTIKIYPHKKWDKITSIEETEVYCDMTCFTVDNKKALFLMNDFIVTHNTRLSVGDACYLAYPIRYDTIEQKWVSTGACEKVLYIMTEQDPNEIQTMILAYLTGYNEEMFLYGTYDERHLERIGKALDIMERYKDNMLFARIADPCASVVKNLIRKYNIQYGVSYFFYDYIFSSPAMLNEYRDLKL